MGDFAGIMRGEARIQIHGRSDVVTVGVNFADQDIDVMKHLSRCCASQRAGLPSHSLAALCFRTLARLRGCARSGVAAFDLAARRAKAGGDGSRTRVSVPPFFGFCVTE